MNYKLLSKPQFLKMYLCTLFSIIAIPLISQKPQLIVPNQNQLYLGIDNQSFLRVFDNKDYIIQALDSENTIIKQVLKNEYQIIVLPQNKNLCSILIGEKNKKGIKWLDTVKFEIKSLPEAEVFLEGIPSIYKTIGIDEFPNQLKLKITFGNQFLDENLKYQIHKYRVIYFSKENGIIEFSCTTDTVPNKYLEIIKNILTPNSILLFDGIYIKDKNGVDRLLDGFYITYQKANQYNYLQQNNCEYLIQGIVRKDGKLYNYNTNRLPFYKSEVDTLMKDSLWKYSRFNIENRQFECYQMDSFSNNKLMKSYFWNDNGLSVVKYINDSLGELKHYYKNGKLYQKGNILINSKFLNYTYLDYVPVDEYDWHWCTAIHDTVYTPHINTIEGSLYPTGKWQIFYPNGKLNIELYFTQKEIDESYLNKQKYYQIIPTGDCLIYDENGKLIQKINFSNPKN
ncbi:MAG: GldM family protein [Bacteroidota bacterium]|nr:GldM family protein [Bacteroidota bacterium]